MKFEVERMYSFDCPKCGQKVYYDVETSCSASVCNSCCCAVPIPCSTLREGAVFKMVSERFVNHGS